VSRVQLALNVTDIDAAVDFYAKLFDVAPAKRRPGYANFEVTDPDGARWEVYVKTSDAEQMVNVVVRGANVASGDDPMCCAPD
jgi:predicted enzyme related to lactoylglutathione lyase